MAGESELPTPLVFTLIKNQNGVPTIVSDSDFKEVSKQIKVLEDRYHAEAIAIDKKLAKVEDKTADPEWIKNNVRKRLIEELFLGAKVSLDFFGSTAQFPSEVIQEAFSEICNALGIYVEEKEIPKPARTSQASLPATPPPLPARASSQSSMHAIEESPALPRSSPDDDDVK